MLGQNHQFPGVNNVIAGSMLARREGPGRGGVSWQTQGSGKSFPMGFYAQKMLRKAPGKWTFVEWSTEERAEAKRVAKLLLERRKSVIVLDWRCRNDARARVQETIKDALDAGLPRAYTPAV